MAPWLWLVVGLTLSGLTTWYLLRAMTIWQDDQHRAMLARLESFHDGLAELDAGLRDVQKTLVSGLSELNRRLQAEADKPEPEPLFIGAFLPTDAAAADLERTIRATEDHAIAANGATRYSPLYSRSVGKSPRPSSTPAARRAGRAS